MSTVDVMEKEADTKMDAQSEGLVKFVADSQMTVIKDQGDFDKAAALAKDTAKKIKSLQDEREELTKPLEKVKKSIIAKYKAMVGPLESFKDTLKELCGDYIAEQERKQMEAQRRADEEARMQREKVEAQARVAREKEEALRQEQEAAERKAAKEKDAEKRLKLENEAAKKAAAADKAAIKAEAKENVAATVVSTKVQPKVEKQGVSLINKWKAEVKDKDEFLIWALQAGMLEYIDINEAMLTKEAQNTKGKRKWPGVKVTSYTEKRLRQ